MLKRDGDFNVLSFVKLYKICINGIKGVLKKRYQDIRDTLKKKYSELSESLLFV